MYDAPYLLDYRLSALGSRLLVAVGPIAWIIQPTGGRAYHRIMMSEERAQAAVKLYRIVHLAPDKRKCPLIGCVCGVLIGHCSHLLSV